MANLKELRTTTGLSQRAFADVFNIPVRTIQQWEQGISTPPPYVIDLLGHAVARYRTSKTEDQRHWIPLKSSWKICIDDPFDNCERIYPIQQRKVRALIDDITENDNVNEIRIFGSSITEKCHMGSDVDIFVDTDVPRDLIAHAHDFAYDLWTNDTVDERLREEIMTKGVKVYG